MSSYSMSIGGNTHRSQGTGAVKQGFSKRRGNISVQVATAPQLILLYMFLCVLRALQRTQNTQKHVLQLSVAEGDQPVRDYRRKIVPSDIIRVYKSLPKE